MATKVKPPDDFEDAESFLAYIRKEVAADLLADKLNRDEALEDIKFFCGKQWPDSVIERRKNAKKPMLTENYLQALVAQVTGNRRLNETAIKVLPDKGGTKQVAAIRQGIIRNIEKTSLSKVVYDKAIENSAICGIGNFQVKLEWTDDAPPPASADVWAQSLRIVAIPNAMAVIWDRMSIAPDGGDATHVTVYDTLPTESFKAEYPDATAADLTTDTALLGDLASSGWVSNETVRVATFCRMRSRPRMYAMFQDGSTVDITGKPADEWGAQVALRPDGSPVVRKVQCKYAECYLVTGTDLLEGPYTMDISSVPVFRVPGWEISVGEERQRWGIVRPLKDSQRAHNYWRSVIAEKLMYTPRAKWIASVEAVAGREKEWSNAHLSDDALLLWNGETGTPPVQAPPAQLEQALMLESNTSIQAMRDISNIHEASLGQKSNEVSGKAIVARQRVGELGTVIYQDNLNLAIERCGSVLNQLLPVVFTEQQIVKIIGDDDKELLVEINKPGDVLSDLTAGKYSVSVTTGPSYVTKRIELRDSMESVFNAAPQAMAPLMDIWVEAFDFPLADKMAARIKAALPPGTIPPEEMTPEQQQQAQASAVIQQHQVQLAAQMAQTSLAKAQAEVEEVNARTELLHAQARRQMVDPAIAAAKEHDQSIDRAKRTATEAASTKLNDTLTAIQVAHEGEDKRDGARS